MWSPQEWWGDLVWPMVLAAPVKGLRASSVGLAFFAMLAVGLVLAAGQRVDAAILGARPALTPPGSGVGAGEWFLVPWDAAVRWPWEVLTTRPVTMLLAVPVALTIALVVLGALCRSTACALAWSRRIPWTESLGFSAGRWSSLVGAVLGPMGAVWALALVVTALGALVRVPGLNVAGAVLWPLSLGLGLAAAVLMVGLALGAAFIVPAVACDGADAVDAIQRSLSYVFARPVRVIAYLALALAGVLIFAAILRAVVGTGVAFAARSGVVLAGAEGGAAIARGTARGSEIDLGRAGVELSETARWAAGIVAFWVGVVVLLAWSAVASGAAAAITAAYMATRRAVDGQDVAEVFEPGQIRASMEQALAGRAAVRGVDREAMAARAGSDLDEADYQ